MSYNYSITKMLFTLGLHIHSAMSLIALINYNGFHFASSSISYNYLATSKNAFVLSISCGLPSFNFLEPSLSLFFVLKLASLLLYTASIACR